MIQFQSGLWDLAYFGREDALANRSTYEPLTTDRLKWWTERTTSVIKQIRTQYPDVPIVYRTMHRPATNEGYRDFIWDKQGVQKVNFFTDVRAAQIRQLQIAVAEQEGLLLWDFGKIFEGFQGESFPDEIEHIAYSLCSSHRQGSSNGVSWWSNYVTSSFALCMACQAVEATVISGIVTVSHVEVLQSSSLACCCMFVRKPVPILNCAIACWLQLSTDLSLLAYVVKVARS